MRRKLRRLGVWVLYWLARLGFGPRIRLVPPPLHRWGRPLWVEVSIIFPERTRWQFFHSLGALGTGPDLDSTVQAFWWELERTIEDFVDVDPETLSRGGRLARKQLERGLRKH